jgi:biotin carboxyl carrier protein
MKKKFKVTINNKTYEVEVEDIGNDFSTIENTDRLNTSRRIEDTPNIKSLEKKKKKEAKKRKEKEVFSKEVNQLSEEMASTSGSEKEVKAPLPGIIIDVFVSEGQKINVGDTLVVIEAMKMENEIPSEYSGTVEKIFVKKGDTVEGDQILMLIK